MYGAGPVQIVICMMPTTTVKLGLLPKKNCYNIGKDDCVKLWIDDVRPAPEGYIWAHSVWRAIKEIDLADMRGEAIELIDIDHDAGDYWRYGGDYIKLLDWLEETGRNYPIRIHSMNPVGAANMRRIIERNGWKEIR